MKPQDELIYSAWGADTVDNNDRVVEVLQTLRKFFPEVPYWKSGNRFDRGLEDTLEFETPHNDDTNLVKGFDALTLWQKTIAHSQKLGLDPKFNRVYFTMWSDKWEGAFASLSESDFSFDNWDSEFEEERTLPETDVYEQITKQLGALPTIHGIWMLNHSAFAGDPVYLYEPHLPFADYYKIDKYEESLARIREIRKRIHKIMTADEITQMVKDLGVKVESIGENRIFVKFGKLGSNSGKTFLSQLERQISTRLDKNNF